MKKIDCNFLLKKNADEFLAFLFFLTAFSLSALAICFSVSSIHFYLGIEQKRQQSILRKSGQVC
jgi:hypothetical protein